MNTPRDFYLPDPDGSQAINGPRIHVRQVVHCEWNAVGLLVGTTCGREFTTVQGGIPRAFRFCPFCGGPIVGGEGLADA